ncbi:unnamed protein product [Brachionus calyciflorus]|uniref:CRC domain-containing protein n=1 Tax=Brachionus calyciflorus TaxID=104777 RepID=A0A813U878_9BILA|nr:unnamed protein product [Brachionus calyciflorus]
MSVRCGPTSQCKTKRCICKQNNQFCKNDCKTCKCNSDICSNKILSDEEEENESDEEEKIFNFKKSSNKFNIDSYSDEDNNSKNPEQSKTSRSAKISLETASDITKRIRKANLSRIKDDVFEYRDNKDLYTSALKNKIEDPEVDHIIECQMIGHAAAPVFGNSSYEPFINSLKGAVNLETLENYNVTEKRVNASKGACIKNYLTDDLNRGFPLRSVLKIDSPFGKYMNTIFETMYTTYPIVIEYLKSDECRRDDGHVTSSNHFSKIADKLSDMIAEMDLNVENSERRLRTRNY